jgi:hypothetical protein
LFFSVFAAAAKTASSSRSFISPRCASIGVASTIRASLVSITWFANLTYSPSV